MVYGGLGVGCMGKEDEVADREAREVARIQDSAVFWNCWK